MATSIPSLPAHRDDNDNDNRPLDQQNRAADAQLNPHDPAAQASAPQYGTFGHADDAAFAASNAGGRSGANDNPDEFSEFRDREKEAQNAPARPEDQPGHIEQNQATEEVREAEANGADNAELRKAWADDDPRYAGGGTHSTRDEDADAQYPNNDDN
ncbi:hypothetical protein [Hymenobacter daeguensis]